mmetsp:Transcript_7946/g.11996  ORF Transcript_7946/g.11996 Transcript_7946/m.11996 type:complete len:641 (+) Transcript_7946:309-2231(+)
MPRSRNLLLERTELTDTTSSSLQPIELVSPTSLQGLKKARQMIGTSTSRSSSNAFDSRDVSSSNTIATIKEEEEAASLSSSSTKLIKNRDNSVSTNLTVSSGQAQVKAQLTSINNNNTNNSNRNNKENSNVAEIKRSQSTKAKNPIKKAFLKLIPPRSKSSRRLVTTKEQAETVTETEKNTLLTTDAAQASARTVSSASTYDEQNIELELAAYKEDVLGLGSVTTSTSKVDAVLGQESYNKSKSMTTNGNTNTNLVLPKKKKKMGRFSPCFGSDSSDTDSLPESAPESASPLASGSTSVLVPSVSVPASTTAPQKPALSPTVRTSMTIHDKKRREFASKCSVKRNSQLCVTNDENDNGKESSKTGATPSAGWCPLPGSHFLVRKGPNYTRNKKKAPSGPSLYEPVHVHAFRCERRTSLLDTLPIPSVSQLFRGEKLPQIDDERIPHLVIIQYQIPSEQPSMVNNTNDGKGGQLIFYFVASENFCKQSNALLKNCHDDDDEVSGAVKLFTQWCSHCEESKAWRSRFKTIAKVRQENADSGSFLRRFNGKPMLVKESSSVQRGTTEEGMRFLEYTVNMHKWAFVPKKGIVSLVPQVLKMTIDLGFTIEAREDRELPEVILASITMDKIKPNELVHLPSELHV